MNFWRVLRVIASRRWIILTFVVLAAGIVFLVATFQSQKKLYEAEALLEPQDLPLSQVLRTDVGPDGKSTSGSAPVSTTEERTNRISDLVMLLRSNNSLYLKTARLLRQTEEDRAKQVGAILARNGYFVAYDNNLVTQANSLVAAKQLLPAQKQEWLATQKTELRKQVLDSLVKASDDEGSFAPTGMKETEDEISAEITDSMNFDTVAGPLNTENAPQIVNQIRITGRFEREAQAKLFVNMLCVAFIDYYTVQSASGANSRIADLDSKKNQAVKVLNDARTALANYRLAKGVLATAQQEQLTTQLAKAQDSYDQTVQDFQDAQGQVASLQQSLLSAQNTTTTPLPADQNPQVVRLQAQIADLDIQLAQLRGRNLGDEYPDVALVLAQRKEAQRQLAQAINRPYGNTQASEAPGTVRALLNQAQARRDGLQQRLAALGTQVATLQQQVQALPQVINKLAELNRNIAIADRNVQDIDSSLSRYQLLTVDNGRAGTISIISQAHSHQVSGDLASQRGALTVIAGILAAILCTAGVVIFDALDPSVRTAQDAEKLYGIPVEGIIPEQTPEPMLAAWVTYRSPDSPVAEAYRLLRTRLLFIASDHPFQSLLVLSARPGQGSTTTASNLAITLAQDGKRVILVDANLRDPQLHNLYNCANDTGLTTLLTVDVPAEDVLRSTPITNLELLPAGPMPLNPSELLGSPRMRYIHQELKKRADFIVFDTPSVVAFADAAILSSYLDASLLVVRANSIPRESEKQVRSLLEKARANIIGLVFNVVPVDQMDAVNYHAHYYAASRRSDQALPSPANTMPRLEDGNQNNDTRTFGTMPLEEKSYQEVRPAASVPTSAAGPYTNSRQNGHSDGNGEGHTASSERSERSERSVAIAPRADSGSVTRPSEIIGEPVAPVQPNLFSSAADNHPDAPAIIKNYTRSTGGNTPTLTAPHFGLVDTQARSGAGRWVLWAAMLAVAIAVVALALTIGKQINVR